MGSGCFFVRSQLLQGDVFCVNRQREIEELFDLLQGLPF